MSYEIPTSIELSGQEFKIRNKGDYRIILDCFDALEDAELTKEERLFASLLIFYEDCTSIDSIEIFPDLEEAIKQMFWFINCGKESGDGRKVNYKLIDWDQDSQLICSAVNKVAGVEIRSVPYMHWWTFLGYYSAIGDCPLSTIIMIRDKIVRGKKLEKHERSFKNDNPQYFIWNKNTVQDDEAERWLEQIWNSEK